MRTPGDYYRLAEHEQQLLELEGFAELSVRNLLAAIDASKGRPFARVLFALGIEEVGEVTARNLAQRFRDDRRAAGRHRGADRRDPRDRREDGALDPRAAPRAAHARSQIADLRLIGLRFAEEGPPPSEGPFAGLTLVLTGTLPNWTREYATERIQAAGGRVTTLGLQEDPLPRRRRERGLQARKGSPPARPRARRGRACRA